jgi:plastocyanin
MTRPAGIEAHRLSFRINSAGGLAPGAWGRVAGAALISGMAAACGPSVPPTPNAHYTPRAREITITTVPLLVKEQAKLYPFLPPDFKSGGVLDGKEVYAFVPSTITVAEGDTIHFTFINPEDDVHSFVLPDFAVSLPGQKMTTATYVARHAGIFTFTCAVASHLPMMRGELVVLNSNSAGS